MTIEIPLHSGANLISLYALPDDRSVQNIMSSLDGNVFGVVGEGVAANPHPVLGWVGSLSSWQGGKGYWLKIDESASFSFDIPEGLVRATLPGNIQKTPIGFDYSQSTLQAFYFVEDILLDGESIQNGDWVMAYNGNVLVGAREWNGAYTDIPVMGYDGRDETIGYMGVDEIPTLKLLTNDGSEYLLENIPIWSNNALFPKYSFHDFSISGRCENISNLR